MSIPPKWKDKSIHKEWHDMESLWLHKIIAIITGNICSWHELSDI